MGLSVKWATMNVGATSPEEFGDYFSWGETSPKNGAYNWENYEHRMTGDSFNNVTFKKYVINVQGGDNKKRLEYSDDAARVNWGKGWRIPTSDEFRDLINNCVEEWVMINGIYGFQLTSRATGNSIFLPASGICGNPKNQQNKESYVREVGQKGYYWSSDLYSSIGGYGQYASCVEIDSAAVISMPSERMVIRDGKIVSEQYTSISKYKQIGTSYYGRYYGLSIRPVIE